MAKYVGQRIVPKHCGVWDSTKEYEMDCIVYEEATGDSYISRKAVPAGTVLSREEYWALCARFSEQMALLRDDVQADVKEMHSSLEKTEKTVNQKTDNAVDTMTQRTQAAEKLTNSNKSELNSRMDTLEKRLDANVTASTTPGGDYAAEVVDARVGWDDTAYASLGAALRGQMLAGLKYSGFLTRQAGTEDLDNIGANTIYQISSDTGETTLAHFPDYKGHGVLFTTGVQDGFMYQIFYGGEGDRIFLRCHTTAGWRDWRDLFRNIDAEFDGLYENLCVFGMEDLLHRHAEFRSSATVNGITFTHNGDGSITASGTAAEDVPGFYNMCADYTKRLEGIEAGETYVFRLTGDTEIVRLQAFVDMDGTASRWTQFVSTQGCAEATVPEGSSGFLVRVMVPPGETVDGATVYPSISRKYTQEEYYQKTGEQLAKGLKYAGNLTRNSGTQDLNDLPVNTIYLVSSSSGGTTLPNFPDYIGHGVLMTIGTQGGYTYQMFFTDSKNRQFLRFRYGDGTWVGWKNITDVSSLDQKILSVREQLFRDGIGDMLCENMAMAEGTDKSGVAYALNDEGTITVSGSNTLEEYTFHNLYVKTGGLPSWQKAGGEYICGIYDDTGVVAIHGYWYDQEKSWKPLFGTTKTSAKYTIPEEAQGVLFRLEVPAGARVDTKVCPYVKRDASAASSNSLRHMGYLMRTTGTEDMNEIPVNTIYLISSNAGETTLLNFPDYKGSGMLVTAGDEGAFTYQLFIGNTANNFYLRFRYGNGTWAEWRNVIDGSAADGSQGTNPNSHMLSYGNSILSGSVWTDEKYNHLSAYYNAPYGVIANAVGIPRDNVKHTVVSSTGLLYDAGQGSFLDNIKKNDLSPYDVVLTHLWTADMSRYKIGTENAAAGDGTIAGGVIELLKYMKESNGHCQLILVGVPPTSTSVYGDAVFTGKQGNGSSIAECDELMHKLAKKYHFTFVDWEGLNIAYYYHDFSDGMNVHANNEDTYRIMGAYLGARASMELRF